MEFIDTQIISYKFKNNKELFDGDIKGKQISSIVALEFLGILTKNENRAKMYPIKLRGFYPTTPFIMAHRKKGFELGRKSTDKIIIDFNGEFDSIVIYSNEAISYLINGKYLDVLLLFAKNTLDKEDFKRFRERAQFLIDNEIIVVPITQETVSTMQCIYENIKNEYNVKDNYRNSFMDLLIVATAVEKKERLISQDKELNKALKKCCEYLNISTYEKGISSIDYCDRNLEKRIGSDNKDYINNSWRIMTKKRKTI